MSRLIPTHILIVLLGAIFMLTATAPAQTTWYVDDDAPPGGDGLTWGTAFDELDAALQVVSAGDEVRVGGGLYTPENPRRGHIIAVHIFTDFWPDETTWELVQQGAGVVATGGPYDQVGHLYTHEIPVYPACHDFTIFDAACNGLVPGIGYYEVYADGELVGSGGEFGCSETVPDICPGAYPREATFQLVNGVGLYGGFAGYGAPEPNERNIELYETVLSGDFAGNDDPAQFPAGPTFAENSYHVVTGSGTDGSAVLDGFTLSGGNANGLSDETAGGGGMYNNQGSPTVRNCTFEGNYAIAEGGEAGGGGAFNWLESEPTFIHCVFTGNAAEDRGGAVCNNHQWTPGFTPTFHLLHVQR